MPQADQDLREELFGSDSDEEGDALNEVPEPADAKRKAQVRRLAGVLMISLLHR